MEEDEFQPQMLREFLESSVPDEAIRSTKKNVARILAQNIHLVLELILKDPYSKAGYNAFFYFTKPNSVLVKSLATEDSLFIIGTDVINSERDDCALSRLASLLSLLLVECPEVADESCGLLFNLLRYSDNQGVFDLFKSIVSPSSNMQDVQKSLSSTKFHDYARELVQKNDEVSYSVLSIISMAANNKILWPDFCTNEMCDVFIKMNNEHLYSDTSKYWMAVDAITCRRTAEKLIPLLPQAVDIIKATHTRPFQYITFVLEFLAKMVSRQTDAVDSNFDDNAINGLLRLIMAFPDSTNLMCALFRFIEESIKTKEIRGRIISSFLPLFAAEAPSRVRSAATANCALIISIMQEESVKDPELKEILEASEEYNDVVTSFIPWYLKTLSASYGGYVDRPERSLTSFI